jgi:hypothetical protein
MFLIPLSTEARKCDFFARHNAGEWSIRVYFQSQRVEYVKCMSLIVIARVMSAMLAGPVQFLRVAYVYLMATIVIPIVFFIPACLRMVGLVQTDVWRLCTHLMIRHVLRVRIRTYGAALIEHGVVVANHISMTDGGNDNYVNHSEGVYRGMYVVSMLLLGLIAHMQGWGIRIHRGRTDRNSLVACIGRRLRTGLPGTRTTPRVLLYPEVTRVSYYHPLASPSLTRETVKLKYGTLRSIYETLPHTPVQVCVSLQKDCAFRRWARVDIPVYRSKPLLPDAFATCTEFTDAILDAFVECTHALHADGGWIRET